MGNFGLSKSQALAQMALWCVWSAPLFMSTDLRSLKAEFGQILKHKQLIEVDQDRLGVFGQLVAQTGSNNELQAFVKPVEPVSAKSGCPSFVVLYLNRATLGNKRKVSVGALLHLLPFRCPLGLQFPISGPNWRTIFASWPPASSPEVPLWLWLLWRANCANWVRI